MWRLTWTIQSKLNACGVRTPSSPILCACEQWGRALNSNAQWPFRHSPFFSNCPAGRVDDRRIICTPRKHVLQYCSIFWYFVSASHPPPSLKHAPPNPTLQDSGFEFILWTSSFTFIKLCLISYCSIQHNDTKTRHSASSDFNIDKYYYFFLCPHTIHNKLLMLSLTFFLKKYKGLNSVFKWMEWKWGLISQRLKLNYCPFKITLQNYILIDQSTIL